MDKKYWDSIKELARGLRKNQTESESILWNYLRNRRFNEIKFFRQHPIIYSQFNRDYFFIADFYSAEARLVIEVDGKIHDFQKDYDLQRDLIISNKGLKIIRVRNEEVTSNVFNVLRSIEEVITHPLPLSDIREGCPDDYRDGES